MRKRIYRYVLTVLLAVSVASALQAAAAGETLPMLGSAPDFTLTTQDGAPLALSELRGKAVVVSFIFTRCPGPCPLLTAKLVGIQKQLGDAFGKDVFFLSVSVDPEYDRPEVLKRYAETLGSDLIGWAFLTGTAAQVRDVTRQYGVFHQQQASANVDHNLLTSLIDRDGNLRLQYMGERFDPAEFVQDLQLLMHSE